MDLSNAEVMVVRGGPERRECFKSVDLEMGGVEGREKRVCLDHIHTTTKD